MSRLVLIRHGQSAWNKRNLFTGWVDIPLSHQGVEESVQAGRKIKDIPFDIIFVSTLVRAQMTCMLAMLEHADGKIPCFIHPGNVKHADWYNIHGKEAEKEIIPVIQAWELNERMYGSLQGLNKQETREKFGDDQVHIWRRSFDVPPPGGESLKMTAARTLPYFENTIVPHLKQGKNVVIFAHGNSLRSIMMELDGLSEEEVVNLELATGDPVMYRYNHGKWEK